MKNLCIFFFFNIFASLSNIFAFPVDLVNPLQGTNSTKEFSTGNTYPAVAVPWGMNFWTPQTRNNGNGWQFVYTDLKIQGFKQTHQPSPWINDYGCFSIMPQMSKPEYEQNKRSVTYKRENEKSHPYLYEVTLDNGIKSEMTATSSGAVLRFTYPSNELGIVLIDCFDSEGEIMIDTCTNSIKGYSSYYSKNHKATLPANFRTYFIIQFDKKIKDFGSCCEFIGNVISGKNVLAYVSFGTVENVNVKVASSFISYAQAEVNLKREIGSMRFVEVKEKNKSLWNKELSRISINGGTLEQQRTFYTALYRTMLFPRKVSELDDSEKEMHYSFYNGKVYEGPMYADNGFWDTFRAVHPFFTIMYPSFSNDFMNALINIYKEGGWLPEWFSPGYKDCMIGQNSVSVITDALIKGIDKYDKNLMFEAILKSAENTGPNATGRVGIELYDSLGYIPCDVGIKASVSRTLEYSYNDFCVSVYASKIGTNKDLVDFYKKRSLSYRNIVDSQTAFARPKYSNGDWLENFSPNDWNADFTEGSSWHWTWCVFHDIKGLIELMGGKKYFIEKLDSVFSVAPTVGLGGRKKMIHEMTEMIAGNMGQYAHGNQPIQHMVYLYNYAGAPYKTQKKVHQIMDKLYNSGINDGKGLCGDEDNGQTSAWYIFSALGFYPVCPGSGEYVIGSPLFRSASLKLENGKTFTVETENYSPKNIYINSAMLNDKPFNSSYITHEQIMNGGNLKFVMSDKPNRKWASNSLPTSLSD